jgi:hypothetical protein
LALLLRPESLRVSSANSAEKAPLNIKCGFKRVKKSALTVSLIIREVGDMSHDMKSGLRKTDLLPFGIGKDKRYPLQFLDDRHISIKEKAYVGMYWWVLA